jgi:seryl-tRNA synthetase
MHDIKWIRDNSVAFDAALSRRGLTHVAEDILALDKQHREILTELQRAQARRNEASKLIGQAKAKGQSDEAEALMGEVAGLKTRIPELESQEAELSAQIHAKLTETPNLPSADTPDGTDENDNVEIRRWGALPPIEAAKEHFDIGEPLGMDFEAATRLSGARFVVLRGQLARLERALAQFMLDLHTSEFGYQEMSVPLLVKSDALFGTGQLPKFQADMFETTTAHFLISTSEISLTNLVREQILDAEELPLRFTAYTPCFRSEAGAAGRDTRGMIRQHQFGKVELVSITTPDASMDEHERMVSCAETVLKRLELPFRTVQLCTGDMGFSARKTYDLEVWLPGQGRYREISSCSNCGDFQARRMNARYRPVKGEKGTQFVHTLNGSGLAVGRTLVAVLETYQQPDGSVTIPDALLPYMGGITRLEKAA